MTAPGRPALIHLPETESTSLHLKRLLADGAPPGTAVLADRQFAGYGQRGRTWTSPAGAGLYLSVAMPLAAPPTLMPLAVGVAARQALLVWTPEVGLKWVNDLVARGRKLGGILVEVSRGLAVVGIGINVASPEVEGAIGLEALTPTAPTPPALAQAVLDTLEAVIAAWESQGPNAVLNAWRAGAVTLGQDVVVNGRRGRAVDVGPGGELVLQTPEGHLETIVSGTVRGIDGSYCGPTP